ncbi:MAG: MBL fold metallo-hydrolase [Candidatus Micrarchaeia archaeon]
MRLTYIGHSCFQMDLDGITAYTDPFFSMEEGDRKRLVKPAVTPDRIRECDLLFISHEHFDHCEVASVQEIVERTYAQVVAPRPTLAKLTVSERSKVDVREGDKFEIKGVGIEVLKAVHPQSAYPVGFKITKGGKSVYFAGDTYKFPTMNRISADVAIVPIGGTYTMDAFDAASACNEMQGLKYAVPMHYNTHDRIQQDPREFERDVRKAKVVIMEPGDGFEF